MIISSVQFNEAYGKLPRPIREFLAGEDLGNTTREIGAAYSLHVDTIGALEREVSTMLLGLINPAQFVGELKSVGIPQESIGGIVEQLNAKIFIPLREKMQHPPEEEESDDDSDEDESDPEPEVMTAVAQVPATTQPITQIPPVQARPAPVQQPIYVAPTTPVVAPAPVPPPTPVFVSPVSYTPPPAAPARVIPPPPTYIPPTPPYVAPVERASVSQFSAPAPVTSVPVSAPPIHEASAPTPLPEFMQNSPSEFSPPPISTTVGMPPENLPVHARTMQEDMREAQAHPHASALVSSPQSTQRYAPAAIPPISSAPPTTQPTSVPSPSRPQILPPTQTIVKPQTAPPVSQPTDNRDALHAVLKDYGVDPYREPPE